MAFSNWDQRSLKNPYTLSRTHIPGIFCIQIFRHCPGKTLKTKTTDAGETSLGPVLHLHPIDRNLGAPGSNFLL